MKKTLLPLLLFSLTIAGQAQADERMECASAYEQTQRSQQKGEMITALDQANRCARASCPNLLKKDCAKWVTEIQSKLPTVVVRARGSDGCEHTDAKVNVTGSSHRGTDTDADAIVVDPGTHDLIVADPAGTKTKTTTINFAAGERRDIDIDFADPDAVCGKKKSAEGSGIKIPTASLVIGGIGAAAFVTGFFLGVVGKSKRDDLDACRPNCSQDKIDSVKPFFVLGDVIGGIGLVGVGAAVATYFILQPKKAAPPPPDQEKEKEKEKEQAGLRLLYASPAGFAGTF